MDFLLARWQARPPHHFNAPRADVDIFDREVAVEATGQPGEAFQRVAATILCYEISPHASAKGSAIAPARRGRRHGLASCTAACRSSGCSSPRG